MLPSSLWVIAPFFIIILTVNSFFRHKISQFIVISLLTLALMLEISAIYFSGGFVDYQYYVNINLNDILEGLVIFKWLFILSIALFFLFVFLIYKATRLIKKIPLFVRIILLVISVLTLSYPQGPIAKLYEIYEVTSAPKKTFKNALEDLNIDLYPTKKSIIAKPGKNIVVISLESFEQGFFNIPGITPNLNKIKDHYHFFPNMEMARGSSWTTASMYTYMTGVPFLIGGMSTKPFDGVKSIKLISLGDVLSKAGYQTRYIIGQPTFSGIGDIISMFGIKVISEKDYPNQYPEAPFGLYDKDTFDIAKKQIKELSSSGKPFALFISSISTHMPNGFADERMKPIIDNDLDNMLFTAASLDHNLGDFIHYLDESGQLENTVFYIFPDHLMMGAGTYTIQQLSKHERKLYLLTNAELDMLPYSPEDNIYQIDLPRMILDGAGVISNARFFTDYLDKKLDKKDFIEAHKAKIGSLNFSAK